MPTARQLGTAVLEKTVAQRFLILLFGQKAGFTQAENLELAKPPDRNPWVLAGPLVSTQVESFCLERESTEKFITTGARGNKIMLCISCRGAVSRENLRFFTTDEYRFSRNNVGQAFQPAIGNQQAGKPAPHIASRDRAWPLQNHHQWPGGTGILPVCVANKPAMPEFLDATLCVLATLRRKRNRECRHRLLTATTGRGFARTTISKWSYH